MKGKGARAIWIPEFQTHGFYAGCDRGLSGEFGDQDSALVSNSIGRDVLVTHWVFAHRVGVVPSLVRKGTRPNVRRMGILIEVADRCNESRGVGQRLQLLVGNAVDAELEFERRDDRTEVCVSTPFTIAVCRPLNVHSARSEAGQCAGHGEAAIVVGVDADVVLDSKLGVDVRHDLRNVLGKGAAVCVTEDQRFGTRACGGPEAIHRICRVCPVAIEEVFGVVEDSLSVLPKKRDGIRNHLEVLCERHAKHISNLRRAVLADDGDH